MSLSGLVLAIKKNKTILFRLIVRRTPPTQKVKLSLGLLPWSRLKLPIVTPLFLLAPLWLPGLTLLILATLRPTTTPIPLRLDLVIILLLPLAVQGTGLIAEPTTTDALLQMIDMAVPPLLLLAPALLMITGLLQTATLIHQCPLLPLAVMTGTMIVMIIEAATGAIGMTLVTVVLTTATIAIITIITTIAELMVEDLWKTMIGLPFADMTLLEMSSHNITLVQVDDILQTVSNSKDQLIKLRLLVIPIQFLVLLLLLLPASPNNNNNVLLTRCLLISISPQNQL
jgi:hypothetical protein